jgi:NAD(P)-dependent dehydrogenase (short-subunit alcohol dehydrogenase family)
VSGPIDTKIFRDGEALGLFDSDMLSKDTLLGRMGKAEEVANVLCFLLSDDASYVTGGKFHILFGFSVAKHKESAHWNVDGGYLAC